MNLHDTALGLADASHSPSWPSAKTAGLKAATAVHFKPCCAGLAMALGPREKPGAPHHSPARGVFAACPTINLRASGEA